MFFELFSSSLTFFPLEPFFAIFSLFLLFYSFIFCFSFFLNVFGFFNIYIYIYIYIYINDSFKNVKNCYCLKNLFFLTFCGKNMLDVCCVLSSCNDYIATVKTGTNVSARVCR